MELESFEDYSLLTRDELIELVEDVRGKILEQDRGIKIMFPGKAASRRLARKVKPRVLQHVKKYGSSSEENTQGNMLLEGDNLQAMATLYKLHGKVDLILTDPPYNTGGDWRYSDSWDEDPNDDGAAELVSSDDRAKHTKWMKFMFPRLTQMREMLKPGGVLAICIDQRELFRLGNLMDEVFGEANRLAIINWQKSYSPKSDSGHVSTATEYVLIYAKDEKRTNTGLEPRTEAMNSRYQSPDGDERVWKPGDVSAQGAASHQGMVYGVESPFTGELFYPPVGSHWRIERKQFKGHLESWGVEYVEVDLGDDELRAELCGLPLEKVRQKVKGLRIKGDHTEAANAAYKKLESGPWGTVFFGQDGKGRPQRKQYLEDVKQGRVPMTYWADEDIDEPEILGSTSWDHVESGHSQAGVNELTAVVGSGHGFDTVKPLKLFKKIIQIWCPQDGLVLDPFAGSGTTGQAVLELNRDAQSSRQFVLIERGNPESKDKFARSLTADRLKRVVDGKWANGKGEPAGGGFDFYTLTRAIDAGALLAMERTEMVDTVVSSHPDTSGSRSENLVRIDDSECQYLVAKNQANEGFYLVWDGADKPSAIDENVYIKCVEEGEKHGLNPKYHVYSRYHLFATDGVVWYPIPERILADLGIGDALLGDEEVDSRRA